MKQRKRKLLFSDKFLNQVNNELPCVLFIKRTPYTAKKKVAKQKSVQNNKNQ